MPLAEAEEGMKRFIDWFLYERQEPDGWAPGQAVVFLLVLSPFFYMAWLLYEGGKP